MLAADYPDSFQTTGKTSLWLERVDGLKRLAVLAAPQEPAATRFRGEAQGQVLGRTLLFGPLDAENAAALREAVPGLRPTTLGLQTSAGFGDRLGVATPGHARAVRASTVGAGGHTIVPIFAQQSMREMERTGRSAPDVLNDATWGAFQAGWNSPLGADADHLKTLEDIDATSPWGYSWYTIDPGAYVDDGADWATPADIHRAFESLPWHDLETDASALTRRYAGRSIDLDDRTIRIDGETLARAAVKYGRAIAHVSRMYRHLVHQNRPFELEMSVDETETPTSQVEHLYIASELRRLQVHWVSLAPRFVGSFEKGVDYLGDLDALRTDLEGHAAIARSLGPYKLSLHSGSDKFLVYPLLQEATGGLLHLKTAGTSYLEALRVVARLDTALFREILAFSREHYERDRVTYHVSAKLARVPAPERVVDAELSNLLDHFDTRQVLHVTFGSALTVFHARVMQLLSGHEEEYAVTLERHFRRHLEPFTHPSPFSAVTSP